MSYTTTELYAGLGLRRDMLAALNGPESATASNLDFFEVAPENWMGIGGRPGRILRSYTERFPFFCHGLSLSIGSPAPLDLDFVKEVKSFLEMHAVLYYSEHLSYCSDDGHLYDLLPIPFTEEAIEYVSERIRIVQDILERPLILENVSAYAQPGAEMSELDFFLEIIARSGARILLDVNNVHVNSQNHGYDARDFISKIPARQIEYYHIAGHLKELDGTLIDTHGSDVIDPVWSLLALAYELHGVKPTLLERDFNIPEMDSLMKEINRIRQLQNDAAADPSSGQAPGDIDMYD
ncbi:MAG: DUF692 domain-containing protein [Leptospiraceae bacterium]|tara:strand:+ start:4286 stop:5167 length:882 start_codon:yes stop_codon:yes gene_type:complete